MCAATPVRPLQILDGTGAGERGGGSAELGRGAAAAAAAVAAAVAAAGPRQLLPARLVSTPAPALLGREHNSWQHCYTRVASRVAGSVEDGLSGSGALFSGQQLLLLTVRTRFSSSVRWAGKYQ